jgi:SAM-dependent methyltransferase
MSQLTEHWCPIEGDVPRAPTLPNRIYQLLATFRFHGVQAGVVDYYQRLQCKVLNKGRRQEECESSNRDQRFAVGDGQDRLHDLVIQSPNAKWGLPYEPTHPGLLDRAVQSLPIRLADYDFVDFGAGKGLALLLASRYPFKSITGIEYSKSLADVASLNIRADKEQSGSRACIQCIWADAADFQLPNTPTVLYLFNPFQGVVMDRVIANIEKSLRSFPRDLWVLYENPWEGRKFRRSRLFETIEWNEKYSIHRSRCR